MKSYHESQKKAIKAYRERMKESGRKIKQFTVTDEEYQELKRFLEKLRRGNGK